jgi:hypothetical protein
MRVYEYTTKHIPLEKYIFLYVNMIINALPPKTLLSPTGTALSETSTQTLLYTSRKYESAGRGAQNWIPS